MFSILLVIESTHLTVFLCLLIAKIKWVHKTPLYLNDQSAKWKFYINQMEDEAGKVYFFNWRHMTTSHRDLLNSKDY